MDVIGNMRRRNREIKEQELVEDIFKKERICHVAFCADNQPYVIPMMYVYHEGYIYIHCAEVGTKLDILEKNKKVCIQVGNDKSFHLIQNSGQPCDWGFSFETAIAFGEAQIIDEREEKVKAYNLLIEKIKPEGYVHSEDNYVEKKIKGSKLIKVKVDKMTGKKWDGIK